MPIEYREGGDLPLGDVLALYRANRWSAADRPERLSAALLGSDAVVTAWEAGQLVGLGNALSDGALVVYYPHLLVLPSYQGRGIGRELLARLRGRFHGFHQHVLVADPAAAKFYERCGFTRAGATVPMWIFADDHTP